MLKLKTFRIDQDEAINAFLEKQPSVEGGIQMQGEYVVIWYSESRKLSSSEAIEIIATHVRKLQQNMIGYHYDKIRWSKEMIIKKTKAKDDHAMSQYTIANQNIESTKEQIAMWERVIEDMKKGDVEGFRNK